MKNLKSLIAVAALVFGTTMLTSCNQDNITEDENLYETEQIEIGVDKTKLVKPTHG